MRYLMVILLVSIFSIKSYANKNDINLCNTIEFCAVGQTCHCQVTPDYAFDRYFYVNFTGVTANDHFKCQMAGDDYTVDFGGSNFPEGASYQCISKNCPEFPVVFNIDTTLMRDAETDMKIRYAVPASDMTFPIAFSCREQ